MNHIKKNKGANTFFSVAMQNNVRLVMNFHIVDGEIKYEIKNRLTSTKNFDWLYFFVNSNELNRAKKKGSSRREIADLFTASGEEKAKLLKTKR